MIFVGNSMWYFLETVCISLFVCVCVCVCVFLSVLIRGTDEFVFQEFEVCYVMVSYVRFCSACMHGVHVRVF